MFMNNIERQFTICTVLVEFTIKTMLASDSELGRGMYDWNYFCLHYQAEPAGEAIWVVGCSVGRFLTSA